MSTSSIFVKYNEKSISNNEDTNSTTILSKKDVIESIPENYKKTQDKNLCEVMTEWRWRFFKIPKKENELVEISYKCPNEPRKYINNKGDWVENHLDESYDKYVTSEYYAYNSK